MNSLIIESPHRQGVLRRFIQGGITLAFWGIWIYLMLPLLTPLMAMAGIEHALLTSLEPIDYLKYILPILLFVGVLMLSMELWVRYNIFLHRRSPRQERKNIVYRTQLARHFGVPLNELTQWHRSEQITIRLTEQGKIHDIKINSPSRPATGPKGPKEPPFRNARTRFGGGEKKIHARRKPVGLRNPQMRQAVTGPGGG